MTRNDWLAAPTLGPALLAAWFIAVWLRFDQPIWETAHALLVP